MPAATRPPTTNPTSAFPPNYWREAGLVTRSVQNGSPRETNAGTLKTLVNISGIRPSDLRAAPLGERIRYVRRSLGLSFDELARRAGIGCNTLTRLERGENRPLDAVLGRVLRALGPALQEAFPGTKDIFDLIIPPKTFGNWLRNLRLRHGLQAKDLAADLGVHKVSVCRYEKGTACPDANILGILRERYDPHGELNRWF